MLECLLLRCSPTGLEFSNGGKLSFQRWKLSFPSLEHSWKPVNVVAQCKNARFVHTSEPCVLTESYLSPEVDLDE